MKNIESEQTLSERDLPAFNHVRFSCATPESRANSVIYLAEKWLPSFSAFDDPVAECFAVADEFIAEVQRRRKEIR